MARSLLSRLGLSTGTLKQQHSAGIHRKSHEWTLKELAGKLEMPEPTLYAWLRKNQLKGRKVEVAKRSVWLVQADKRELDRLRKLRITQRPSANQLIEESL